MHVIRVFLFFFTRARMLLLQSQARAHFFNIIKARIKIEKTSNECVIRKESEKNKLLSSLENPEQMFKDTSPKHEKMQLYIKKRKEIKDRKKNQCEVIACSIFAPSFLCSN